MVTAGIGDDVADDFGDEVGCLMQEHVPAGAVVAVGGAGDGGGEFVGVGLGGDEVCSAADHGGSRCDVGQHPVLVVVAQVWQKARCGAEYTSADRRTAHRAQGLTLGAGAVPAPAEHVAEGSGECGHLTWPHFGRCSSPILAPVGG